MSSATSNNTPSNSPQTTTPYSERVTNPEFSLNTTLGEQPTSHPDASTIFWAEGPWFEDEESPESKLFPDLKYREHRPDYHTIKMLAEQSRHNNCSTSHSEPRRTEL